MKVLFLIESLRAGGKERRLVELLKGLKKIGGIESHVVVMGEDIHYKEVYDLNIPVHIMLRKVLKKDPIVFYKLFRLVKKIKPDVIHVWGHMVAVYSVPTKILLGIPLINNELTDAMRKYKLGKHTVFRFSDRIIANTYAGLKAYNPPASKSHVIYNGFSFERLKELEEPNVVRQKFAIETPYVIGMVATFYDYKDYRTYIKAANKILESRNDVTFLCIGDGDYSDLKELVPEKHAGGIRFLGKQNRVEAIMNICDIGVLTTNIRYHAEGISNAMMEFMALEKPVITTNFGGSPELVEDKISGFLIDGFSDVQLAERIIFLLQNESERKRMGKNAAQRVKEKFSIEQMIKAFHSEYMVYNKDK